MFGTLKLSKKSCTIEQRKEYKKYYCGLCCSLGNQYGNLSRLFVNFDLTNDYLLSAIIKENCIEKTCICPWSWRRKKITFIDCPEVSDYFAKLNYILVYYKMLDDVQDENSFKSKIISKLMAEKASATSNEITREVDFLLNYLDDLHKVEEANEHLPIITVAEKFGVLLEQMVRPSFENELDEDIFLKINYWTGIWIYTMDAILDCVSDYYKNNYNPITAGLNGNPLQIMRARKEEILKILKSCKENVTNLIELYPTFDEIGLLKELFSFKLPKTACLYLEVKEDELYA